MQRMARLATAAGLLAGLSLVALPASPALALGRCQPLGAQHAHWDAAHRHNHVWTVIRIQQRADGRLVFTSHMEPHKQLDTAVC